MKKNSVNVKGFAMTELLAVSIVILLIFSVLVSNYIPLLAEYDNRTSYTNVTADYAAFYVRKIYKEAMDDDGNRKDANTKVYNSLINALNMNKYQPIYKEDKGLENSFLPANAQVHLQKIISTYNIEEIIITKYKLEEAKSGYMKSSGALFDYIKYLPKYSKSQYGTVGSTDEPLRIILKTRDYGFATTQILPDPPTPSECFVLSWQDGSGFVIDGYVPERNTAKCDENKEHVIISSSVIKANDKNGNTHTGNIVAIGPNAFKNKGLLSIDLGTTVKTIGANAFENNEIKTLHIANQLAGVTAIGDEAFKNNKISRLIIPAYNKADDKITYGNGVFSNNYLLSSVDFDYGFDPKTGRTTTIPNGIISMDDNSSINLNKRKAISIFIPYTVTEIGDYAFKNVKMSSLEFDGLIQVIENKDSHELTLSDPTYYSKLKSIGTGAFMTTNPAFNLTGKNSDYVKVNIPKSVESIKEFAFYNVKASEIKFEDRNDYNDTEGNNLGSHLNEIGDNAFAINHNIDSDVIYDVEGSTNISTNLEYINAIDNIKDKVCEDYKKGNIINEGDLAEVDEDGNPIVDPSTAYDDSEYHDENGVCIYDSVRGVKIPTSTTSIGDGAFANEHFNTITFSDYNADGTIKHQSGVTSIGAEAFLGNKIKSIIMPGMVTELGAKIFGEPDSTTIGNEAGSIVLNNSSIADNEALWCNAIYGYVVEEPDEGEESGTPATTPVSECKLTKETTTKITEEQKDQMIASCEEHWNDLGYESEAECKSTVLGWYNDSQTNKTEVYYVEYKGAKKYITILD